MPHHGHALPAFYHSWAQTQRWTYIERNTVKACSPLGHAVQGLSGMQSAGGRRRTCAVQPAYVAHHPWPRGYVLDDGQLCHEAHPHDLGAFNAASHLAYNLIVL